MPTAAAAAPQSNSATSGFRVPHVWVHYADVDGDGISDRVRITPDTDFRVHEDGAGFGHYIVHVAASSGANASKRVHVAYYYGIHGHVWTPWYGAAQVDHFKGKEILVGDTTGAHTLVFHMLTYWKGRLFVLAAPGSEYGYTSWAINGAWGTGSEGWKCTPQGIESREVYPNAHHTYFHVRRVTYRFDGLEWFVYSRFVDRVPARADGSPPKYTWDYALFDCSGLPSHW